jgi:hypothetical protein
MLVYQRVDPQKTARYPAEARSGACGGLYLAAKAPEPAAKSSAALLCAELLK